MAEKLFEDVDELFQEKPRWSSDIKTVGLEIPEFLKKIEDKKTVESPTFQLPGAAFYIKVAPGSEFTRVELVNGSKKAQTASVTFLEGSGAQCSLKMQEIKVNHCLGFSQFLSHEKFKTWAKKHGDVFKLKAVVTLHQKATGEGWIRY